MRGLWSLLVKKEYSLVSFIGFLLLVLVQLLCLPSISYGQTNEDCLTCHSDADLKMEKMGKEISLYVNETLFKGTKHSKLQCISCHSGFDPSEMPHKENIEKVNCYSCHSNSPGKHVSHPKVEKTKTARPNIISSCKSCHGTHRVTIDKIKLSDFKSKKLTEKCLACHTEMSTSGSQQTNDGCLMCHSDETLTMKKGGKEIPLYVQSSILKGSTHSKLSCVSCHTGFNQNDIPHKAKIEPVNCQMCHRDAPVKHPFHPQIMKDRSRADSPDISCKNCHGTHNVISTKSPQFPYHSTLLTGSCGKCHSDIADKYVHSAHSKAYQAGIPGAPDCLSCHKTHITTKTSILSPLNLKIHQEKVCLSCHLDNPDVRKRVAPSAGFISAYEKSVHGEALYGGKEQAANCIDCHSSHDVHKGSDASSKVHKFSVAKTCSQCHTEIANEYFESSHGKALDKGIITSPTCTNCHGEHEILHPSDPKAAVSTLQLSSKVCMPCHSSLQLSAKYGLSADRFKTFRDSYHGLAIEGGSVEVANCASCHGYHNIKPSSDPTSTVHKSNLVSTCGKCHPNANENFAKGTVHLVIEKEEEPVLYWIATIYIILIIVTIGGMLFHNGLDFVRKSIRKKKIQRGLIVHKHHGHALYLRMTVNERIQHFLLLTSFFTLVTTGFMLSFPNAWWVEHIRDLIPDSFTYRSLLHRIAAVVMVAVSIYHIFYLAATERGRQLFKDLLPVYQDLKDAIGVMKYNLGISDEKPKLDRFSYVEKAEYWALVWGTIVMTVTGFVMWFENYFIGIFTKLGWDIARTIHYYEAWLAFLAIIVWHLYFVIFNPDSYPMNIAWLKGTLTEEEMADEHALELERIKSQKKDSES